MISQDAASNVVRWIVDRWEITPMSCSIASAGMGSPLAVASSLASWHVIVAEACRWIMQRRTLAAVRTADAEEFQLGRP